MLMTNPFTFFRFSFWPFSPELHLLASLLNLYDQIFVGFHKHFVKCHWKNYTDSMTTSNARTALSSGGGAGPAVSLVTIIHMPRNGTWMKSFIKSLTTVSSISLSHNSLCNLRWFSSSAPRLKNDDDNSTFEWSRSSYFGFWWWDDDSDSIVCL